MDENYTYIVRCADGTLYTGWTNDLKKRIKAHNSGKGAKYTKTRRPVELVYFEHFATKEESKMRSEITNTTRSPQDLGQHIQVLTHALQGIAGSIGMAPAFVDAPQFFYNYMYGDWHPYMEASEPATADLKVRNQNVLHLVNYLESLLPKEAHRKVEEYIDAVNNRYTAELDYAYMVGFQTAFRMMLLGITDPELIMSKIQPTADS